MATAEGHSVDLTPGAMAATGGSLDAAIEGEGFFMVEGQNGNELTRSGAFTVSPELVEGLRRSLMRGSTEVSRQARDTSWRLQGKQLAPGNS